jgi:hypothetical protein
MTQVSGQATETADPSLPPSAVADDVETSRDAVDPVKQRDEKPKREPAEPVNTPEVNSSVPASVDETASSIVRQWPLTTILASVC